MSTTSVPIEDIRRVLPVAIVNRAALAADCLLPEGGSEGVSIEAVPGILRAALFAIEAGGFVAPETYESPYLGAEKWRKIREATREILTDWHDYCTRDPRPPRAEEQIEATVRVLAWLDSLDVPTPDPEEVAA